MDYGWFNWKGVSLVLTWKVVERGGTWSQFKSVLGRGTCLRFNVREELVPRRANGEGGFVLTILRWGPLRYIVKVISDWGKGIEFEGLWWSDFEIIERDFNLYRAKNSGTSQC